MDGGGHHVVGDRLRHVARLQRVRRARAQLPGAGLGAAQHAARGAGTAHGAPARGPAALAQHRRHRVRGAAHEGQRGDAAAHLPPLRGLPQPRVAGAGPGRGQPPRRPVHARLQDQRDELRAGGLQRRRRGRVPLVGDGVAGRQRREQVRRRGGQAQDLQAAARPAEGHGAQDAEAAAQRVRAGVPQEPAVRREVLSLYHQVGGPLAGEVQVRETRRGSEALGPDEAERQHDLREVQPRHALPLPPGGAGLRPHRPPRLPVRPQRSGLPNRQPQLQGQARERPRVQLLVADAPNGRTWAGALVSADSLVGARTRERPRIMNLMSGQLEVY